MKIKELTIRFITPNEGYVLYNAQIDTFSNKVQLGCNDNASNWQEIEISSIDENKIKELKEQGVI